MRTITGLGQVHDRVRAIAAARRVPQRELARALGITQQAVSRRLVGAVAFRVDELQKIAALLGVPLQQLLVEEDVAS